MQFAPAFVLALAAQRPSNSFTATHESANNNQHTLSSRVSSIHQLNSARAANPLHGRKATALKAMGTDLISPETMAFGKMGLTLMLAFGVSARALALSEKIKDSIDAKDETQDADTPPELDANDQLEAKQSQEDSSDSVQSHFNPKELKKLAVDLVAAYVIVQCLSLVGNEFNALQELNSPMGKMIQQADAMDNIVSGINDAINSGTPPLN